MLNLTKPYAEKDDGPCIRDMLVPHPVGPEPIMATQQEIVMYLFRKLRST